MGQSVFRRSCLTSTAVGVVSMLAGCEYTIKSTRESDSGSDTIEGAWPMRGYDLGYTYYNPTATQIDSAPTTAWRETFTADQGSVSVSVLPPLVGQGRVYTTIHREKGTPSVASNADSLTDQSLHALHYGGDTVWQFEDVNTLRNGTVLSAGVVVFADPRTDGLVGIDAADGTEAWRYIPESATRTYPRVRDETAIATTADGSWITVDAIEGDLLSQFSLGDVENVFNQFAIADGSLVTTSGSDGEIVRSVDATTGDEEWRLAFDADAVGGPTVRDDVVLVRLDGIFAPAVIVAISLDSGTEQWRTAVDHPIGGRIVADDERAVVPVMTDDENVRFVALDHADGTVQWRSDRSYPIVRSPVGAGNAVIAHDGDAVFAVNLSDGDQRWRQEIDAINHRSQLVVAGATVYVTADRENDGILLALS